MTKTINKIPLYLGVFVFTLSVLASVVKLNREASISQKARAVKDSSFLSLQFAPPETISLFLSGEKAIAGVDVVIKFDGNKVSLLPSSLLPSEEFVTSGGVVDEKSSLFSFSAIAKKDKEVSRGLVATFKIKPKELGRPSEVDFQFVEGAEATSILEKVSLNNILGTTQGIKISLPVK